MARVMLALLPLRLTRAAVFSAVCVTLAALGHVAAGGSGPEPWALAAGAAAVVALSVSLAGRERSAGTVTAVLTGAQAVLHELFALGGGPAAPSLAGHLHDRGLGQSLGMLLAHLTATLITGWWLARGETALWALLRAAAHHLGSAFRLLTGAVPLPAPPPAALPVLPPVPVRGLLRHTVSRRGPPLPAV
ncbi:MFS transporter [Planomonospora parontospora]|uniref:MFS transporter n=1 Tax=Planomonospora parontospora TaxID=58119 RepID=UPI001940A76D|nr:MFS transporter [Planomonospora parontospora]